MKCLLDIEVYPNCFLLGYKDFDYKDLGAQIINDNNKLVENADILLQLGLLENDKLSLLKSNQTYIGVLNIS